MNFWSSLIRQFWQITMIATTKLRFLFNNEVVILDDFDPDLTVLQYLREVRCVTGTKEGCASGDCGACTVVIAELSPQQDQLIYRAINSCIAMLGYLNGKQLITIEHLQNQNHLHPIQQSFVDHHASQCGFCTPGFVMSTFALHKNQTQVDSQDVERALAGNLCRCTGYQSIVNAAVDVTNPCLDDQFAQASTETISQLKQWLPRKTLSINHSNGVYFAPVTITELAHHLQQFPDAQLIAGGTDQVLELTQNQKSFSHQVYLGDVEELNAMEINGNNISIGAAVPYVRFAPVLEKIHKDIGYIISRIGSEQIRERGTLGGNIGNASPIGDMPPLLLALDARIDLQCGEEIRTIGLDEFYLDYKKTVLQSGEFIRAIQIDTSITAQYFKAYKISKRIDDDISAVLAVFAVDIQDGKMTRVRVAFGGMAAIPKRARNCEKALSGQPLNENVIATACEQLSKDFQPLSDVRASASYRLQLAQNLLKKCFHEITQPEIPTRVYDHA